MFIGRLYALDSLPQEMQNQIVNENNKLTIKKKSDEPKNFIIYDISLQKKQYLDAFLDEGDKEPTRVFILTPSHFDIMVTKDKQAKLGHIAFAYPKYTEWNEGMEFLVAQSIISNAGKPQIRINDVEAIQKVFAPKAIIKIEFESIPSKVDHRVHDSTGKQDISKDSMVSNDIKSHATINTLILQCNIGKAEGRLILRADGKVSFVQEIGEVSNDEIALLLLESLLKLNLIHKATVFEQKTLEDIFKNQ